MNLSLALRDRVTQAVNNVGFSSLECGPKYMLPVWALVACQPSGNICATGLNRKLQKQLFSQFHLTAHYCDDNHGCVLGVCLTGEPDNTNMSSKCSHLLQIGTKVTVKSQQEIVLAWELTKISHVRTSSLIDCPARTQMTGQDTVKREGKPAVVLLSLIPSPPSASVAPTTHVSLWPGQALLKYTYPQIQNSLLLLLTSRNSITGHEETGSAAGTQTRIPVAYLRQEPIFFFHVQVRAEGFPGWDGSTPVLPLNHPQAWLSPSDPHCRQSELRRWPGKALPFPLLGAPLHCAHDPHSHPSLVRTWSHGCIQWQERWEKKSLLSGKIFLLLKAHSHRRNGKQILRDKWPSVPCFLGRLGCLPFFSPDSTLRFWELPTF